MAAAMAFQWSLATLETLMAEDQMDQHAAVLRAFSVVELWRLRRVCRAFHRWGTAALAALPRIVAVGGERHGPGPTAGVEVLDLSNMRWSASGALPALPEARGSHAAVALPGTRLAVVGGHTQAIGGGEEDAPGLQWVPGTTEWAPLPQLSTHRDNAATVALPDGRAMAIGGRHWVEDDDDEDSELLASVEVLAADGSGWSALAPMGTARAGPATVVLPCGKVLVAGGMDSAVVPLKTAELWDPATRAWSDLPPMERARSHAGCCVLPSGRVAVVGGQGIDYQRRSDGEAFDLETGAWSPLTPMEHDRSDHGLVAVAGGLVAVGGCPSNSSNQFQPTDELFDEASGRWFELPHPMSEPRIVAVAVSLPASALAALAPPTPAAEATNGP